MQKPSKHRYPREVMVTMRELVLSRTRPSMLSKDFDNDDGLFSPDKWMQYRWQCEGIETRPLINKKKFKGDGCGGDLEQTVLSPQRRGFSSGCRAPSPKNTDEEKHSKSRWRQGQQNNGVDFKPAFQKSALDNRPRTSSSSNNGQPTVWRNSNSSESSKPWGDRSNRGRHNFEERIERVPEWLDEGPSSMTDIIELKGFEEDDVKEKRTKKKLKTKDTNRSELNTEDVVETKSRSNSISQSSRPSSRALATLSKLGIVSSALQPEVESVLNEGRPSPVIPEVKPVIEMELSSAPKSFPNSDAEFAAYMGLLDLCDIPTSVSQRPSVTESVVASNQPSSSRLSRFFSNNPKPEAKKEVVEVSQASPELPALSPAPQAATQAAAKSSQQAPAPRAIVGQHQSEKSPGETSTDNSNALPPMLQQLFANAAPKHVPGEQLSGVMTVEELERNALLGRPSTSNPTRPASRPDNGELARAGFYPSAVGAPHQQPNPAAINAFLHAQFQQNMLMRQAAAAAAAAAKPSASSSEFNGMMTVEELERNTLMAVHPNRVSPMPNASSRQLDLSEMARQGTNFSSAMQPNPAIAAAIMQAQLHQQQQSILMHQAHQQQQQQQIQQQKLLLQQAPLPVLQKLFANANSPSSSSSSPPSAKFKYPPPPAPFVPGLPPMQQQFGGAGAGNHIPDPAIMEKIMAHQAALNNGYIPSSQAGQFPPNFRLPMPPFDASSLPSLAEQHQQLNLALTRGDLVAAQTIRNRIIAQALASGVPFPEGNQ